MRLHRLGRGVWVSVQRLTALFGWLTLVLLAGVVFWGGGAAFAMPGLVKKDHMYSRLSNPNRDGFEACLASLEGGKRTSGARRRAWLSVVLHLNDASL